MPHHCKVVSKSDPFPNVILNTISHFQAVVDEGFANQLKELSSGSGTYINQKGVQERFVRPTPMAFLSNNPHLFGDVPDPTAVHGILECIFTD